MPFRVPGSPPISQRTQPRQSEERLITSRRVSRESSAVFPVPRVATPTVLSAPRPTSSSSSLARSWSAGSLLNSPRTAAHPDVYSQQWRERFGATTRCRAINVWERRAFGNEPSAPKNSLNAERTSLRCAQARAARCFLTCCTQPAPAPYVHPKFTPSLPCDGVRFSIERTFSPLLSLSLSLSSLPLCLSLLSFLSAQSRIKCSRCASAAPALKPRCRCRSIQATAISTVSSPSPTSPTAVSKRRHAHPPPGALPRPSGHRSSRGRPPTCARPAPSPTCVAAPQPKCSRPQASARCRKWPSAGPVARRAGGGLPRASPAICRPPVASTASTPARHRRIPRGRRGCGARGRPRSVSAPMASRAKGESRKGVRKPSRRESRGPHQRMSHVEASANGFRAALKLLRALRGAPVEVRFRHDF